MNPYWLGAHPSYLLRSRMTAALVARYDPHHLPPCRRPISRRPRVEHGRWRTGCPRLAARNHGAAAGGHPSPPGRCTAATASTPTSSPPRALRTCRATVAGTTPNWTSFWTAYEHLPSARDDNVGQSRPARRRVQRNALTRSLSGSPTEVREIVVGEHRLVAWRPMCRCPAQLARAGAPFTPLNYRLRLRPSENDECLPSPLVVVDDEYRDFTGRASR